MVMLNKKCYRLTLGSEDHPDRVVECATLQEASIALRNFVVFHDLGASQLSKECGTVKDQTGGIVAYVSYNGRLWGTDGRPLT